MADDRQLISMIIQPGVDLRPVRIGAKRIMDEFKKLDVDIDIHIDYDDGVVRKANDDLKKTKKNAQEVTSTMGKLSDAMAGYFVRFSAFTLAASSVFAVTRSISEAQRDAIDFDKQLIKVAQVTNSTRKSLGFLSDEIFKLGKNIGATTTGLFEASVTLSQAGFTALETKKALEALAKAEVSPTFGDMKSTVEGVIAILQQFNLTTDDTERSLSAINAVASQFAVESEDIISAVRKAGGVFASANSQVKDANQSFAEFIGLFTSIRATTRESADTVAVGLRTILTRLQRTSTTKTLERLGIKDLRDEITGEFVGATKAIEILSKGLRSFSQGSRESAQIVELLGGARQIGKVVPLLREFETATEATAVAMAGMNSLTDDTLTAQDALATQFAETKASFQELLNTLAQDDGLRDLITLTLKTTQAMVELANSVAPIIPLIAGIGLVKALPRVAALGGSVSKKISAFSTGGFNGIVPGSYSNQDDHLAFLAGGEGVIRASSVRSIGNNRIDYMNKFGQIPGFNQGTNLGGGNELNKELKLLVQARADLLSKIAKNQLKLDTLDSNSTADDVHGAIESMQGLQEKFGDLEQSIDKIKSKIEKVKFEGAEKTAGRIQESGTRSVRPDRSVISEENQTLINKRQAELSRQAGLDPKAIIASERAAAQRTRTIPAAPLDSATAARERQQGRFTPAQIIDSERRAAFFNTNLPPNANNRDIAGFVGQHQQPTGGLGHPSTLRPSLDSQGISTSGSSDFAKQFRTDPRVLDVALKGNVNSLNKQTLSGIKLDKELGKVARSMSELAQQEKISIRAFRVMDAGISKVGGPGARFLEKAMVSTGKNLLISGNKVRRTLNKPVKFGGGQTAQIAGFAALAALQTDTAKETLGDTFGDRGGAGTGGALTGGIGGALAGATFGPLGIAIGGLAGAAIGASVALKKFDENLQEFEISKAADKLTDGFENTEEGIKGARKFANKINQTIAENKVSDVGFGSKLKATGQQLVSDPRALLQLSPLAHLLGKSGPGFDGKKLEKTLFDNADLEAKKTAQGNLGKVNTALSAIINSGDNKAFNSSIKAFAQVLSQAKDGTLDHVDAIIKDKKALFDTIVSRKNNDKKFQQITSSFADSLTTGIRANDKYVLSQQEASIKQKISLGTSATDSVRNFKGLGLLGTGSFQESLDRAPVSGREKDVLSNLNKIIPALENSINTNDPEAISGNIDRLAKDAGVSDEVIGIIQGRLNEANKTGTFSTGFQEALKTNGISGLIKILTQDLDPALQSAIKKTDAYVAAKQREISELSATVGQRNAAIGARSTATQAFQLVGRNKRLRDGFALGGPSGVDNNRILGETAASTGARGVGNIGKLLEALDEKGKTDPRFKVEAENAANALRKLSDSGARTADVLNKLSMLEGSRASRRSLTEKRLFATSSERREIDRRQSVARTFVSSGADISKLGQRLQRQIIEGLREAGGAIIGRTGKTGDQLAGEALDSIRNGGRGPSAEDREIERLKGEATAIEKSAAQAALILADRQDASFKGFISLLEKNNKDFLRGLEDVIKGGSPSSSVPSVDGLASFNSDFGSNVENLANVIGNMPSSIDMNVVQTVNVVHNGAQIFSELTPGMEKIAMATVEKAINNFSKANFPDAKPFRNA